MSWRAGKRRSKSERDKISRGVRRYYLKPTSLVRTKNKINYSEPYNYEGKLDSLIRRIEASNMPLCNKKTLNRYREDLQLTAKTGFVYGTMLTVFNLMSAYRKPFDRISENEILNLYRHIQGNGYSDYTKADKIFRLKHFLKWMNDGDEPRYFRKMRTRKKLKAEKYISLEDIERFIRSCESKEEKAFFSLLWEGGFSVGELLTVRRKDLTFRENVLEVYVEGKNRDRVTPILREKGILFPLGSYGLIKGHLDRYKPQSEEVVWSFRAYNQVQYRCKKIRKKIGLEHIHIHSFRKSRATYNDEHGMSGPQNCVFGGWRIGSKTLEHYILTSGRTLIPTLSILNQHPSECFDIQNQ